MFRTTRSVKPLLLAGIAAAAYYAYSRMTSEQKQNLIGTLKQQGKDLLGRVVPSMNSNNTKTQSQQNEPPST